MNPFRIALPLVSGRGAGLGNEMITWAKAFIAGQALGLRVEHPAWGLNQRKYYQYFSTPRWDWAWHRSLRTVLPFFRFDDFQRIRLGGEFEPALRAFAAEHDLERRKAFVLGVQGMGGGYAQLAPARDFLHSKLLAARGVSENLYDLNKRIGQARIRVGLHVRRGDFGGLTANESYQGRFNVAVPTDWYASIVTDLARNLGDNVAFIVVSDAEAGELQPILAAAPCHLTSKQRNRDVSDLLALASCDFLVCSISSYSLWAAFLSERRYGWYAPNLTPDGGFGTIWGHEAEQQSLGSPTRRALAAASQGRAEATSRGVAIGKDGKVPEDVIEDLRRSAALKRYETDLLYYGATALP